MLLIVTITSTLLALVMSAVAWHATREERRRSAARVAALTYAIHGDEASSLNLPIHGFRESANDDELEIVNRPAPRSGSPDENVEDDRPAAAPMFGTMARSDSSGSRWSVALAAGGLIVATVAAAAIVFSGEPSDRGSTAAANAASVGAAARVDAPLELVALGHDRDGDRLTVRGVVRNPSAGSEKDRLTAVVSVFDRDGAFLRSSRAAVESAALVPGSESTFIVTVPAAADVGRYRVSFQCDDRVVSHVDKRNRS